MEGSTSSSCTHDDDVVAGASFNDVSPAFALNGVIVAQSDDGICTCSTNQSVGGVSAQNGVVTRAHLESALWWVS